MWDFGHGCSGTRRGSFSTIVVLGSWRWAAEGGQLEVGTGQPPYLYGIFYNNKNKLLAVPDNTHRYSLLRATVRAPARLILV